MVQPSNLQAFTAATESSLQILCWRQWLNVKSVRACSTGLPLCVCVVVVVGGRGGEGGYRGMPAFIAQLLHQRCERCMTDVQGGRLLLLRLVLRRLLMMRLGGRLRRRSLLRGPSAARDGLLGGSAVHRHVVCDASARGAYRQGFSNVVISRSTSI